MGLQSKKNEKVAIVKEIHEKFNKAKSVVLTDFTGLNVQQLSELRNRLHSCKSEYKVVKNTLARIAAEGTDVHKIEDHLSGATGVVFSYEDIITPMKILSEYNQKFTLLRIRTGVLEGTILDSVGIEKVTDIPSRDILLGKISGSVNSPLYGLAFALQAVIRQLVFVLNAVKEAKIAHQV